MIALGLDTSGDRITVGLAEGGMVAGEISVGARMAYLRYLIPAMDFVLESANKTIRDVDLFIVSRGPGAWTGIRIGVTAMKSFAHALEKPIVGVCSLDALAYELRFCERPVYTAIDAARKQVYFSGYDCRGETPRPVTDRNLLKIGDFLAGLETPALIVGNGACKYKNIIADAGEHIVIPDCRNITATGLIQAGLDRFEAGGPDDTHAIAPLYFQKSDAERVWDERQAKLKGTSPC